MPWKKWRNNIYNDFHQNAVESRNNVIVNPPKAHTHMLFEVNSKLKEDPTGSKKNSQTVGDHEQSSLSKTWMC